MCQQRLSVSEQRQRQLNTRQRTRQEYETELHRPVQQADEAAARVGRVVAEGDVDREL